MQVLAGLGPLGVPELLIIAFIVILVFGVGRLPEVGGALGKGIREFRKSTRDDDGDAGGANAASTVGGTMPVSMASSGASSGSEAASDSADVSAPADAAYCSECGARNQRGAKFCSECGTSIAAPVS